MTDLVQVEPVPVIQMREVTVSPARAPEATLITGVEWTVQPADYWLVGGLRGSGKSELLSVAAGVQRPLRGQVFAFGKDTAKLSEFDLLQQRLGIGLVFGSGGRLFHHLTARQNVELPLCYHRNCSVREAHEQVEAVLELTELTGFADYLPRQLTQSFRQRAALARALILRPRVLLLENLLIGMELRQVSWWLDFLARLHAGVAFLDRMPLTLVVAAHNVDPWRAHAKQFAVVRDQQFVVLSGFEEFGLGDEPLLQAVSE